MRGFTDTKGAQRSVLGEPFYQYAIKGQRMNDIRTGMARIRFQTPAYCFGERRKEYERRGSEVLCRR